jgi:exonuclease SbcC
LNLERLLELEEQMKLRGEDEKHLTRLAHRVELARAQAELPGVVQDLQRADAELKQLDLRANVERALQEMQARDALAQDMRVLQEKRAALHSQVTRVDALDRARQVVAALLIRHDTLTQDTEQAAALETERAEIQTAVEEQLPALQARQDEIKRLGVLAARLTRVESVRGTVLSDLQRAQNVRQELDGHLERGVTLNEAIARHEARLAALDEKLRAYEVGEALGEWIAAVESTSESATDNAHISAKHNERDALGRTQRQHFMYLAGLVIAIGLVSAIFLPALVLTSNNLFLGVLVALVLAAIATLAVIVIAGRLIRLNRQVTQLTEDLGRLEGEATAKRALLQNAQGQVDASVAKLNALGMNVPASVGAAQAQRVEIAATLENKTRAELSSERDDEREKLNYARAQRDEVTRRIQDLSLASDGGSIPQLERKRDKAEEILNRWRPRLARRCAPLNVPPETEALRDAYRTTQGDIKAMQARIQQADKLANDAARIQARIAKSQTELREQFNDIVPLLEGSAPAWTPNLPRAAYVALEVELRSAFESAGGNEVRSQMAQVEKQFGALEREYAIRQRNAEVALSAARALETDLGFADGLSDKPTPEEWQTMSARFASSPLQDRAALEAQVRRLNQRVGELSGARERFERELGLVGETVNLEDAQLELQAEQRAQSERKYGAEIVARARRRIVQKVLPATMEYMRRILPQLTRDRYHDAELDAESFKIKVWDERAGQSGAWKEKNIFSGGTKDQFSLALRLAFALATLPQERGASPGFIFLDEPLGSFDDERANALLYLLTEGEVGRAFDQIFLISHVPVQESKFTHRIRLENGTVVENAAR